ncbi:hypothetical protein ACIBJI_32995 [Nocardia sp. NPDC050408]|uniref:hypothetical protein n=1 Tax=unclassified Nocardia TaxID=2637762 RepID=UPI0034204A9B
MHRGAIRSQIADEWLGDLRALRNLKRSTLRNYQNSISLFCAYLIDPAYQWAGECEQRFGTHPIQVVHEWNTAVHVQEAEADAGKRAFTRDELQAFFDHADAQIDEVRGRGRKGWLPAFRDAVLFKTAYAFGLRRNETRMLDAVDFRAQPRGRGVRRLRRRLCPPRQGQEGLPAETTQRVDGLALVGRDP